ncbi:protein of unknown function [Pararobbsia alpina]
MRVAGYEVQTGSVDLYPRLLRNQTFSHKTEFETQFGRGRIVTNAPANRKAL